jgi:hypothetical protein
MYASVFIPSVTRIGTILKVLPGNVANDFMYDVELNAKDEYDVEETIQQRKIDMFEFIGAHSKDAKNWPVNGLAELEVVHCKKGQPPGGGGIMRSGIGTVTGVALDWHGAPCYYEVTMRGDPPGKYYFEKKWVSQAAVPDDDFAPAPSGLPPYGRGKPKQKMVNTSQQQPAAAGAPIGLLNTFRLSLKFKCFHRRDTREYPHSTEIRARDIVTLNA